MHRAAPQSGSRWRGTELPAPAGTCKLASAMHSQIGRIAAGLLLAVLAEAQTSRGTVTGTVTDPSGGVVGGASVELSRIATGVRRMAITNGAGIYRIDAVDLGKYELRVAHAGFKVFVATELGVEANRTAVVDIN